MSRPGVAPRAALLEETVALPGGARIEIALWRAPGGRLCCRLGLRRGSTSALCYEVAADGRARRRLAGRSLPYAFRSVEQLRYDFERDLEALQASRGAQP